MKKHAILFAIAAFVAPTPGSAQPMALPWDVPVTVGGIDVVCTGVSLDAREDPHWQKFSVKVEIAGNAGYYLADAAVMLRKNGRELANVTCDGPWILFQAPPGQYRVDAKVGDNWASAPLTVNEGKQTRVVLRFPELEAVAYSRNYSEEVAQKLGIHNRQLDVFSFGTNVRDGMVPDVNGGVSSKGARLRLQWSTH